MRMWPAATLRKAITAHFRPFAEQHGFRCLRRTLLLRERQDTLHIVNFDVVSSMIHCMIAIQPLYVPAHDVHLDFGNDLGRYAASPGSWGLWDAEADVQRSLVEMERLLVAHALPWFSSVGKPEGIVSLIEALPRQPLLVIGFPPYLQQLYLGFSYLYVGKLKQGQRALAAVGDRLRAYDTVWAAATAELAESMRILARDEPARVAARLQEFVAQNRANIKLE